MSIKSYIQPDYPDALEIFSSSIPSQIFSFNQPSHIICWLRKEVKNIMNKVIAFSILAGVMMLTASPAHALTIGLVNANANLGTVHNNNVASSANTGGNVQSASNVTTGTSMGGLGLVVLSPVTVASNQQQLMITGNATAGASQMNVINSGCPCTSTGTTLGLLNLNLNAGSSHDNNVAASANTGGNAQSATNVTTGTAMPSAGLFVVNPVSVSGVQGQQMQTGHAVAISEQWNVINSAVSTP